MDWLLNMPGNEHDILDSQVTVRADDWFGALRAGLKRVGMTTASNLSCVPAGDGAVEVRDFVSGRVYFLQPVSPDATKGLGSERVELFGRRDVVADEGGVSFRERFICVPAQLSVAQCEKIARDVLKKNMEPASTEQLVVSVHVYDHRFSQRPKSPALVRLAWQQWKPSVIRVDYPATGAMSETLEEAEFFQVEPSRSVSKSSTSTDPFDMDILCKSPVPPMVRTKISDFSNKDQGKKGTEKLENEQHSKTTPAKKSRAKREGTPERSRARKVARTQGGKSVNSVDDGVLWAFEQMQEMYLLKEHDAAAKFVRDVITKAVPSAACAVMLTTPGKYELYVAAQTGLEDLSVDSVRIPMLGGIVGAALKTGVVLNVADPLDSRFNANVDLAVSFSLTNVLVVPVAFEGHVVGVVQLFNRQNSEVFSQDDVNVASYVAGAFAEFVQVSLPSREADFHDGEFAVVKKRRVLTAADQKKSVDAKKGASKASSDSQKNATKKKNASATSGKTSSSAKSAASAKPARSSQTKSTVKSGAKATDKKKPVRVSSPPKSQKKKRSRKKSRK